MAQLSSSSIQRAPAASLSAGAKRARRKFLRMFPRGFQDETYVAWERDYKWQAHVQWREALGPATMRALLRARRYEDVAQRAARIEGRTNLIFSFEKMALRDGLKGAGAERFVRGLHAFLHGRAPARQRFEAWVETLASLPRKQTRVLTWPVATVFGFIADPKRHIFIKPNVMRRAAELYGAPLAYASLPNWETYASAMKLARQVKRDLADLKPKDMIDIQSFLWVQGSDEYEE